MTHQWLEATESFFRVYSQLCFYLFQVWWASLTHGLAGQSITCHACVIYGLSSLILCLWKSQDNHHSRVTDEGTYVQDRAVCPNSHASKRQSQHVKLAFQQIWPGCSAASPGPQSLSWFSFNSHVMPSLGYVACLCTTRIEVSQIFLLKDSSSLSHVCILLIAELYTLERAGRGSGGNTC